MNPVPRLFAGGPTLILKHVSIGWIMGLFSLIARIRKKMVFKWFYGFTRLCMGAGFVGSGIRKLPGIRFTVLPVENPVGFFFEAMHQTAFYWNTIAVIQIILGILIFFNRTVVATVLIMMPITINIFLVSISLSMKGTPIITTAMLLANLFLLFWHYENYLSLLRKPKYLIDDTA